MTRAGPGNRVGVVAFVDKTQDKLMLSDKLYRIVPSASLIPRYLALLLSSDSSQRQLNATKTGLAESQSNISQVIVSKLIVCIPPKFEQTKVVATLCGIDNKILRELILLKKLELQKKGLMQDLLTGKVRVIA